MPTMLQASMGARPSACARGDQRRALRARVQPHLGDALPRDLARSPPGPPPAARRLSPCRWGRGRRAPIGTPSSLRSRVSCRLTGTTSYPCRRNARTALLPNLRRSLEAPMTATRRRGVGVRHREGSPFGPIYNRQVVRRATLLLLLLCGVTFLAGLGRPAIGDSDEAFYAEAAREMRERGDWLTPYYNYETRFQKPVLLLLADRRHLRRRRHRRGAGTVVGGALGRRAGAGHGRGRPPLARRGHGAAGRRHRRDQLRVLLDRTALAARSAAGLLRHAHRVRDAGGHARGPSARHALAGAGRSLRRRGVPDQGPGRPGRRGPGDPAGVVARTPRGSGSRSAVRWLPWRLRRRSACRGTSRCFSRTAAPTWTASSSATTSNDSRPAASTIPGRSGSICPSSSAGCCRGRRSAAAALPPLRALIERRENVSALTVRLLVWALVPLLFFTASIGKQPRYILPILPPLALLLAIAIQRRVVVHGDRRDPVLQVPAAVIALLLATQAALFYRARPLIVMVPAMFQLAAVSAIGAAALVALGSAAGPALAAGARRDCSLRGVAAGGPAVRPLSRRPGPRAGHGGAGRASTARKTRRSGRTASSCAT